MLAITKQLAKRRSFFNVVLNKKPLVRSYKGGIPGCVS